MRKQQLRSIKNKQRYPRKKKEMQEHTNTLLTAKVFYEWFEENMADFKYKPQLKSKDSGSVSYTFEGICPKITLCVDFSSPEAMICYRESEEENELWTMHKVLEYIGWEKYDSEKGYYDADRMDEIYTYFPTKAEMYIQEVFETIPKYCEEHFKPGMNIYTSKKLNGFSATIAPKTENMDEVKGWWGATMFFGTIEGDDDAVNHLKEHRSYDQAFDLLSCEEDRRVLLMV